MSIFIIESKYKRLEYGTYEDIWIRKFINEVMPEIPIVILILFRDNKTSSSLTKN